MSRGSGSPVIYIALFLVILFMVLPAGAGNATANTTTAAPSPTPVAINETAVVTTQATIATNETTVTPSQTTTSPAETTVATTEPTAVTTTVNPTLSPQETETTGSMMIYSSPAGATILIDGIYCGITPKTVSKMTAGNHILRLELSRYYPYEGSVFVVPGQTAQGYGTLQPLGQVTSASGVIVPVIVTVATATPVPTQDQGLLGNSSVIIALLGAFTVLIAAGVSIFIHLTPPKKE